MDLTNLNETISSSLNSLYNGLIHSFNTDSFSILDDITFIDTSILGNDFFSSFLANKTQSIIYIVNALLIAFLIYYGISYLFSHLSGNNVENPLQFLIKFTVCAICVNSSYFICEQIINIFDIITDCLREFGFFIFSSDISFTYLSEQLNKVFLKEMAGNFIFFSFDGILNLFITLGFFNLLFTYSYRYILIKVLILLSPFFILAFSSNSTKWLFKMWLKNFLSLLSIQIVVSILLVIITSLKYSFSDATIKILYIGSLYALIKTTSFVKDFSSGFTTDVSSGISSIKNMFN